MRNSFSWNDGFVYLMKLKDNFVKKYGKQKVYSVKNMAETIGGEYDNFLKNVTIQEKDSIAIVKYSLVKGGNIDIATNPKSMYREYRGLVVDMKNEDIINCPFRKFFNINETEDSAIDIVKQQVNAAKKIEITDKMDGSLISIRAYHDDFFISGTGSIDEKANPRLAEAREMLTDNYKKMIQNYPYTTFIFEQISENDKKIVSYDYSQKGLYLIGMRDVFTGFEWPYSEIQEIAQKYNAFMTKIENISFTQMLKNKDIFKATEKEGWVIKIDNHRYKFKCNDYVHFAKVLESALSPKYIIENILEDTIDDVIANTPDWCKEEQKKIIESIYAYMRHKVRMIDFYYDKIKDIKDDKAFAITAKEKVAEEYFKYMFVKRKNLPIKFTVKELKKIFDKNA